MRSRVRLTVVVGILAASGPAVSAGEAPLSAKDRAFLDANFQRFGSAWEGGLRALEKEFDLRASTTGEGWTIDLTARGKARVRFTMNIDRAKGDITSNQPSRLPDGAELAARDLERVDKVLRSERELWFVEPMNGYLMVEDVSRGLDGWRTAETRPKPEPGKVQVGSDRRGLKGLRLRGTRRFGNTAVLYLGEMDGDEWYCLFVDLSRGAIEAVQWIAVPMDEHRARVMPRRQRDALDRALRADAIFGDGGKCDLPCVMKNADVTFADDARRQRSGINVVHVDHDQPRRVYFEGPPRSGYTLDWKTGKVSVER